MARTRGSRTRLPPGPAAADTPSGLRWRALAIVIAGSVAYSNSLSGPFLVDDQLSIIGNSGIREWWRLGAVLFPGRELPVAGRPLVNFSFAINYALGGLDVRGYHVVNVALHLLCGLIVFGVVRRTLELPRLRARLAPWSTDLAFAVALLWTLHPLNTDAVNYVTQRTELMMALCYLMTLYAAVRAWPTRASLWHAIAVGSCAAGMACKESMVTAPLMVLLYDGIFQFDSLKRAFTSRWRFYAGLATSWILLAVLLWPGPRALSAGFSSGASPWNYLLNQTVMITKYLRLALWPQSLVFYYGWPAQLTLGSILPYGLLVMSLLALTLAALVRWPTWGFLGAWFFVTLAPTSSVVPIATEVGAERRMYLPLIALIALAVMASSIARRRSALAAGVLVICAVTLGAATLLRNREYASSLKLAQTVVDRYPTSFGHHLLGSALIQAGREDEGLEHLRQAVPGDRRAHYSLGFALFRQGQTDEAIEELQTFVDTEPLLFLAVDARQVLGEALAKQQRWSEAIEQFRMVLTMKPSEVQWVQTQGSLALALYGAQNFDEAAGHFAEYLRARPNDGAALTNLGISLVATGKLEEAIVAFRRAVDVDPNNGDSQRDLANALFDHREAGLAVVHARRAVVLRPDDPAAHDLLGKVLAVQGDLPGAQAEFERALQIAPNHLEARENLARLRRRPAAGELQR